MAKIPTIEENPNGWSDWQDMGKKFSLLCCDCSLSHDFEFKIVKGKLLFRASRNDRSTAAARRGREKKKEIINKIL